jgi:hypothetical protein
VIIIGNKENGRIIFFSKFSQVVFLTWFLLLMQGEVAVRVLQAELLEESDRGARTWH